jgi:hypothetical protein
MNAATPLLCQLSEIVRLVAEGMAPGWTAATVVIEQGDAAPVVIPVSSQAAETR